jgi:hypothetical protein
MSHEGFCVGEMCRASRPHAKGRAEMMFQEITCWWCQKKSRSMFQHKWHVKYECRDRKRLILTSKKAFAMERKSGERNENERPTAD